MIRGVFISCEFLDYVEKHLTNFSKSLTIASVKCLQMQADNNQSAGSPVRDTAVSLHGGAVAATTAGRPATKKGANIMLAETTLRQAQDAALPALTAQLTTLNDMLESAITAIEARSVWTLRIDGDQLETRVSFEEALRWATMLAPHFPESNFEIVTA